ncbi:hypothetical protein TZ53_12490 [Sphingobium sp. YBL2]|nr:hypothetical protein TZ53_12490 [Sphingobium sp. YBL2]
MIIDIQRYFMLIIRKISYKQFRRGRRRDEQQCAGLLRNILCRNITPIADELIGSQFILRCRNPGMMPYHGQRRRQLSDITPRINKAIAFQCDDVALDKCSYRDLVHIDAHSLTKRVDPLEPPLPPLIYIDLTAYKLRHFL